MLSFNLTLIIQMVGFLLFAWLFNQVFFKPVVRHIEARDRYLAEQQARAEKLVAQAKELRREHDRRLRAAQIQAHELVDSVVKEAQARRGDRLAKARSEALDQVNKARVQLGHERADLLGELRSEVAGIAALLADKFLAPSRSGERSREEAQA